jgi:gliding motility-associated-like protein
MLTRRLLFFLLIHFFSSLFNQQLVFGACTRALEYAPQADTTIFRDTFCGNQILIIGNRLFDADNPSGIVRFTAANGMDSIVLVNLIFRFPVTVKMDGRYCFGDTLRINGTAYHAGFYLGEEILEGRAANGCDSIIQVSLTFDNRSDTIRQLICTGDTLWVNQSAYHAGRLTGIERIKNATPGRCDSVVLVQLVALPRPESTLRDTLCPGASVTVNGEVFNQGRTAGVVLLPNAGANGCDSLVRVQVSFYPSELRLGPDATIAPGEQVCITPQINFTPADIVWDSDKLCDNPPNCSEVCRDVPAPLSYRVTATDANGCVLRDTLTVRWNESREVFAPNVFQPSAREDNGFFYLSAGNAIERLYRFEIVDRWGDVLFFRDDATPNMPSEGWDGRWRNKEMPPGVYVFHCEAQRTSGDRFIVSGNFLLVR